MKFTEREFIILPYYLTPWNQVFRYKNNWWKKQFHPLKGAVRVLRYIPEFKGNEKLIDKNQFVAIEDEELVATKSSVVTDFILEAQQTWNKRTQRN